MSKGEVAAGWTHDPLGDDTAVALRGEGAWIADGHGRHMADLRMAAPVPADRIVGAISWTYLPDPLRGRVMALLARLAGVVSYRCAAHEYSLAAGIDADALLYNRMMPGGPPAGLAAAPRGRRPCRALRWLQLPADASRWRADLYARSRLLGRLSPCADRPVSDNDEGGDTPPGLPPGTPFYMTPAGAAALREEIRALWGDERPKVVEVVSRAASLADRSENADYQYGKRRLRQIDGRVRFLRMRLDRVQVVDPAAQTKRDQVFFGASMNYARVSDDAEVTIRVVGVDETDTERGDIAWVAPVARALLGARVGDVRRVGTPAGLAEVQITLISYSEGLRSSRDN